MNTAKFFKTGLALAMTASLFGCSSSNNADSNVSSGSEAQHIIIGISPDYPPFDDITTDGELTGYDYDMAEWVFEWLNDNGYNYTHEWKQLSFDTIISAINADQIDLGISGFTYDEDRDVLFSDPYYESGQVALVTADSDITTKEDLEGKKLGAQLGATGEKVANELSPDNTTAIADMGVCVETLKAGGFDAVILDIAIANNYAATGNFKLVDEILLDEDVYIIAKTGNTELMDAVNAGLAAFKESDEYSALQEKYGLAADE